MIKYIHYSREPLKWNPKRYYRKGPIRKPMKPSGLWLSIESDSDNSTWKDFCIRNDFPEELTYQYRVFLKEDSNYLIIDSLESLSDFCFKYTKELDFYRGAEKSDLELIQDSSFSFRCYYPNWTRVKRNYQGIILDPYPVLVFNKPIWYSAISIPSACIWNLDTIQKIEEIKNVKL